MSLAGPARTRQVSDRRGSIGTSAGARGGIQTAQEARAPLTDNTGTRAEAQPEMRDRHPFLGKGVPVPSFPESPREPQMDRLNGRERIPARYREHTTEAADGRHGGRPLQDIDKDLVRMTDRSPVAVDRLLRYRGKYSRINA